MLRSALDANGLWSVTRGLARAEKRYKGLLAECDMRRRNDLDGAGNLSEEALVVFTTFFLETALDQVDYMHSLVQPGRMEARLALILEEEIRVARLTPFTKQMALHLLLYGETHVDRVIDIAGSDRDAGIAALDHLAKAMGLVRFSEGMASFDLPMRLLPRLAPGLFPEDE